jgi:hypothetical protein
VIATGSRPGDEGRIRARPRLAVGAGVGALLGCVFLALSLAGLPVLAWAVLGVVAASALVDVVLTAAGLPGLLSRRG